MKSTESRALPFLCAGIVLSTALMGGCSRDEAPLADPLAVREDRETWSGAPFLVADLDTTSPRGNVLAGAFTEVNDLTLFVGTEGRHGEELWRTDGTAEGTRLVRDLRPGEYSSAPAELVPFKGHVLFRAQEDSRRHFLWRSDGTAAGTQPLAAFEEGPRYALALDAHVLFMARRASPPHAWGLWRSDGTSQGTWLVKPMGGIAVDYGLNAPARLGERIYFGNADAAHGEELWTSDGTEAGTRLVKDIRPGTGHANITSLTRLGDVLLFCARSEGNDFELWRTDGTEPGTVRLRTLGHDPRNSPFPTRLVSTGQAVYFINWDAAHGQELWTSDGTAAGTRLVADLNPGPVGTYMQYLTAGGSRLFFAASVDGRPAELWRSDGTQAGTTRVKEPPPGVTYGLSTLWPFIATPDGRVFFIAHDGIRGERLWTSDGTQAGTTIVTEALTSPFALSGWAHGRLYLRVYEGSSVTTLWVSDGTSEGTHPLALPTRQPPGSRPRGSVNMNGTLYFAAQDGVHGEELWKSDGTRAGTVRLTDLAPGAGSTSPTRLTPLNGRLLFLGRAWAEGPLNQLFSLDGEDGGWVSLADGLAGELGGGDTRPLVRAGDLAYFLKNGDFFHQELWRTDGTVAGTRRIKTVQDNQAPMWRPTKLTAVGARLFFTAEDRSGHELLWTSDGTEPGTGVVKDLGPGGYVFFRALVAAGGRLYFWAHSQSRGTGTELWTSDGTGDGTRALMPATNVLDFPTGLSASEGDTLFFFNPSSTGTGLELWRLQGQTPALIAHLGELSLTPAPRHPTVLKGVLYFWGHTPARGYALWRSDGTPAGTGVLEEFTPGLASAAEPPGPLVALGPEGPLVFAASDGLSGLEPWRTDGTPSGTWRVADLAPGVESSSPRELAVAGAHLFFQADDLTTGPELWALPHPPSDTTPPVLTCPPAPPAAEATGPEGARVRYPPPTATDDTSRPVVRHAPASDSVFPLGTTPVRVSAVDDTGNRSTCAFDVRVQDTTPPTLQCPPPQVAEATALWGTSVDYPAALATDKASTPRIVYSRDSGATFAPGEHTVQVTATDGAGLTASCAFLVTVRDTQPPTITCPPSLRVAADRKGGAQVDFAPPTASDAASTPEVSLSQPPGFFPLGTTEVTATARDTSGNTAACAFQVTVEDTTPPTLTCPADLRLTTIDPAGRRVDYPSATAEDLQSAPDVTYTPPSGSVLPVGQTHVSVTARDAQGNQTHCAFVVTVAYDRPAPGAPVSPLPTPPEPQGCGCRAAGSPGPWGLALLGVLARRRRAARA